ncbi:hypothetical protein [Reyranella sp.]|uniref:hypothetical protein n=1 Tax=Reyranella sp. TaxID=1929291 RepID=UPI003D0CFA19
MQSDHAAGLRYVHAAEEDLADMVLLVDRHDADLVEQPVIREDGSLGPRSSAIMIDATDRS